MSECKLPLPFLGFGIVALGITACGRQSPEQFEVTRLVPQTVLVTQIVEKIVTVTAEARPTAIQTSIGTPITGATVTPWALPEGFADNVYLPPLPLSGQGAVTFAACPNPAGLDDMAGFLWEIAVDLVNNYRSGDLRTMRLATDPALWSLLEPTTVASPKVAKAWIDGKISPARDSTYADMLEAQCGSEVVRLSWYAKVCPGPCPLGGSGALESQYFMFWRSDTALIWVVL